LFIAGAKAELKQTVIRSEREGDLHNQFYTGSLNLELHIQFPKLSNHLQITTTQPQRGDLENHKTHSPSLQPHTSSQNTL